MTFLSKKIRKIIDEKITPNRRPGGWAASRLLKRFSHQEVLKMSDRKIDDELRLELKKISDLDSLATERALDHAYMVLSSLVLKMYFD